MLAEIAAAVTSSVRALEGALIRVVAYASLRGEEPTPALVRHVLGRLGERHADRQACELADILDASARSSGSNEQRCWPATGGPPSRRPARSPCTSRAS